MFDLGMSELLVIGVVALIVVGPKDLPGMFRSAGRFTAKLRAMGAEFSRAMEHVADESGVSAVTRDLKQVTSLNSVGLKERDEGAFHGEAPPSLEEDGLEDNQVNKYGPETDALSQRQVARRAVAVEAADKLRQLDIEAGGRKSDNLPKKAHASLQKTQGTGKDSSLGEHVDGSPQPKAASTSKKPSQKTGARVSSGKARG